MADDAVGRVDVEMLGDFADGRAVAPAANLLADELVHVLLPLRQFVEQSHVFSPCCLVGWRM